MAYTIELYTTFNKRKRSTKRPDTAGAVFPASLKEDTSIVNPTFKFRTELTARWTYAYVPEWDMCYFVVDKRSLGNNFVEIQLACDPLATLREAIFNTTAFIAYSSSNYDAMLNDVRIAQRESRTRQSNIVTSKFTDEPTLGCFVVCIASNGAGLNYWTFSYSQFIVLVMRLLDAGSNIWDDLQKMFGNVMGAIISARYVPFTPSQLGGVQVDNVKVGNYETHASGFNVSRLSPLVYDSNYINIPWTYSDFRRNSNFTRVMLQLPFIGVVDISSETLLNRNTIRVDMVASCGIGIVAYGVYVEDDDGDDILIATYSGTFGIGVPIASNQVDAQGWLNGMIATAETLGIAIATENPIGVLGAGATFAGACVSANKKDITVMGDMGGTHGEEIIKDYVLSVVSVDSRTEPDNLRALYGRPCQRVLRIGDLSGYVQTNGVALNVATFDGVREEAETLLDGGIYLE